MSFVNGKKYNNTKDLLNEEQQEVLRNKGNKIEKLQADIHSLAKPLLRSENSQGWAKYVTPNTMSVFQDEKSWIGINTIESKKKKPLKEFHEANGLSWSHMREAMHLESDEETYISDGSPTTTRLDAKDMNIFGAMPLEEEVIVVQCKNCHRPLLPSKFKEHTKSCIGELSEEEDDDDKSQKAKATSLEETTKRPPSSSIGKTEKKKLKKEKLKKTGKQKAPLDLDKQCGVVGPNNETPCTRSLTCKTHSMGAKRSVEGRSQPYDVLLAAYQKKSIGRPNAKEQAAKTKGATDGILPEQSLKIHQQTQLDSSIYHNAENDGQFIDSDEEVENVMQALKLSRPAPLAQKSHFFVKRRRQCFRLRDVLLDALTPKSTTANEMIFNNNSNRDTHTMMNPSFYQQQQHLYNNNNDSNRAMYNVVNSLNNPSFSVR